MKPRVSKHGMIHPEFDMRIKLDEENKEWKILPPDVLYHNKEGIKFKLPSDCFEVKTLVANVIFEQGLEETLLKNIPRLRKLDEDGTPYITYNRLITNENVAEVPIRDYFGENFWCCLVELYGDYGVTMCTGWIEDKQAFFKMIRDVHEWNK